MPLVNICFDQVFDLVMGMSGRKEVTFFSFTSGTSHQYAVPAPGKPMIQSGMNVTAYLRKESNWQTLVGWKNHATNEIVIESAAYETFWLVILGVLFALLLYVRPTTAVFIICLSALALGGAAALTSMLRIRRIESILQKIECP